MKSMRRTVICLAILFSSLGARAQEVNLGVKTGLAASWLTNTVIIGDERIFPHNGIYAGMYAKHEISDNLILQAELLYAPKGHTDKREQFGKYSRKLGYLQVPVMLGTRLGKGITVMAGPELGYLMYSTTNVSGKKTDSSKECNPFNIALAVQSNYMLNDLVGLDLKFDWGLSKTFKPGMYGEYVNDNGRNVTIQIGVCYLFD